MNIKQKIVGTMATGALLASVFATSAFAANDITISGNGKGSTNGVAAVKVSKSRIKQKNITIVGTGVTSVQNTGGNTSNGNVGSGNNITTGNNTTTTTVDVAGGTNESTGESCCCDGQAPTDNTVDISGNGKNSTNGVLILDVCKHTVKQTNVTIVETSVVSVQNTGGNSSNGNVGGTNDITTGDNTTTTSVTVTGSVNTN